jgi:hypothetical protein
MPMHAAVHRESPPNAPNKPQAAYMHTHAAVHSCAQVSQRAPQLAQQSTGSVHAHTLQLHARPETLDTPPPPASIPHPGPHTIPYTRHPTHQSKLQTRLQTPRDSPKGRSLTAQHTCMTACGCAMMLCHSAWHSPAHSESCMQTVP